MSGSRFLRLSLLLPVLVTAMVWLVERWSESSLWIFLTASLIPYAPFVLLFLAATLGCSERQLLRAILLAPIAFAPFLCLFILFPALLFPDPLSVSALMALVLAVAFGYAHVGLALLLYYLLRRSHVIAPDRAPPDAGWPAGA